MSIYPEELSTINNPDILNDNLKNYTEFNIKIRDTEYNVYLMTDNDYAHKDGIFTATHNLDDNLLDKLNDYDYLTYDTNDNWNVYNMNEMLNQCDQCKSYYFEDKCTKCPILITEKHYINNKYLLIPIQRDGDESLKTKIYIDDKLILNFGVGTWLYPIYWYPLDLEKYNGNVLTITIDPEDIKITWKKKLIKLFILQNTTTINNNFVTIKPQYKHYQHGYCGDINGLVYFKEIYHMFYQTDPFINSGVNMFWGHATSKDLVNWNDEGLALKPYIDAKGQCFSGSGNVKDGKMFFMFTDTGDGETLAFYKGGKIVPDKVILKHTGRDPKVIKYKDHWVMIVSYIGDSVKEFRFYISDNLYDWEHTCSIDNMYECPEFIKFDVEGEEKWVLFEASNKYMIGSFDGKIFTPDSETKYKSHFGSFNASQCFTNHPKNIQIGNVKFTNAESYENTFSTPLELGMIKKDNEYKLTMNFITNNEITVYGSDSDIHLNDGYIIIENATKCMIYGKESAHHDDNVFKINDMKKHNIEIIADEFVYEVLVDNMLYFSGEKYNVDEQIGLKIQVEY